MKNIAIVGAFAGLLTLNAAPQAQDMSTRLAETGAQATTLEGCLRSGTRDGEFALSAGGTDYLVLPGIGVQLMDHLNHQVLVTGSVEKGSRGTMLRASAIKVLATTCSAT